MGLNDGVERFVSYVQVLCAINGNNRYIIRDNLAT